jgi:hypothetical protein
MGASASTAARARARSERIDKQIEKDCQRLKREYKVLLLGERLPCDLPVPLDGAACGDSCLNARMDPLLGTSRV